MLAGALTFLVPLLAVLTVPAAAVFPHLSHNVARQMVGPHAGEAGTRGARPTAEPEGYDSDDTTAVVLIMVLGTLGPILLVGLVFLVTYPFIRRRSERARIAREIEASKAEKGEGESDEENPTGPSAEIVVGSRREEPVPVVVAALDK